MENPYPLTPFPYYPTHTYGVDVMTAEALENAVNNDRQRYDRICFIVRTLRALMDVTAEAIARENAEWHDDPEAEDHAAYHASASEQFPQAIRDKAALSLVKYYLAEMKR